MQYLGLAPTHGTQHCMGFKQKNFNWDFWCVDFWVVTATVLARRVVLLLRGASRVRRRTEQGIGADGEQLCGDAQALEQGSNGELRSGSAMSVG